MVLKEAVEKGQEKLGGKAYARVIVILACVLALDSADKGNRRHGLGAPKLLQHRKDRDWSDPCRLLGPRPE